MISALIANAMEIKRILFVVLIAFQNATNCLSRKFPLLLHIIYISTV